MRVNNQTSDPVDWEQTGGSPNEDEIDASCPERGHLEVGEESPEFKPCGDPPYQVSFLTAASSKPLRTAEAGGILNPDAQVIVTSFPLVL